MIAAILLGAWLSLWVACIYISYEDSRYEPFFTQMVWYLLLLVIGPPLVIYYKFFDN